MDTEPTVNVCTVVYAKLNYGDQHICMPAEEAIDFIKLLAALLPDDPIAGHK